MIQVTGSPSAEQYSWTAGLLLREFSHRINNELASAIGMISLAAEHLGNGEAKAMLAAVQDQLHNYARVQPQCMLRVVRMYLRGSARTLRFHNHTHRSSFIMPNIDALHRDGKQRHSLAALLNQAALHF